MDLKQLQDKGLLTLLEKGDTSNYHIDKIANITGNTYSELYYEVEIAIIPRDELCKMIQTINEDILDVSEEYNVLIFIGPDLSIYQVNTRKLFELMWPNL